MLLRARIVLPVSRPPVGDGFVRIEGNRITEVGEWAECGDRAGVDDLGEVILLPGLVNAHCHLDYTDFIGVIPSQRSFTDWIEAIVDLKSDMTPTAHCRSWLNGAAQSLAHGITTLGNIETVWAHLPDLWRQTPLRFVSYLELIVLKAESNSADALAEAIEWAEENPPPRGRLGISPHAPYTTKADLLAACAGLTDWPMSMHVAESREEQAMFADATGALHAKMTAAGRSEDDCGVCTPLAHVAANGLLQGNLLVVHGNYLDDADIATIAGTGASLVHCPRSHAYFGHEAFRYDELAAAGVNVCLGTDSGATMRGADAKLDLFSEMKLFSKRHPAVSAETLLGMVTTVAARALGWAGKVGEIATGAWADLMVVPFAGATDEAPAALVEHEGEVERVMVDGEWHWPGQLEGDDG